MNARSFIFFSLMFGLLTASTSHVGATGFGGTARKIVYGFGDQTPGLQRQAETFGFITDAYPGHVGIDIAAPAGTPVYAAAAGEVTSPGKFTRDTANEVVVFGDVVSAGSLISYEYVTDIQVTAGEHVRAGQLIAYVAATNEEAVRSHLHFGVADTPSGRLIDPAPLLLDAQGRAECVDPARGALPARDGGYEVNRTRRVIAGTLDVPLLLMPVGC